MMVRALFVMGMAVLAMAGCGDEEEPETTSAAVQTAPVACNEQAKSGCVQTKGSLSTNENLTTAVIK